MPDTTLRKKLSQPLTLFWRLFLTILAILLLTSALSIGIERWINSKELNSRMQQQVTQLLNLRQHTAAALYRGDIASVRRLYRENHRVMSQLRIIDAQGRVIFPRFDRLSPEPKHPPQDGLQPYPAIARHDHPPPADSEHLWQQVSPDVTTYPELEDMTITSLSGDVYTLQLQPRLSLHDFQTLRKNHTLIRIGLILLFSLFACYWLSRVLTNRIQRLQKAVRLISEGQFKAGEALTDLGDDELGMLAKDMATLAARLTDSELARKQMLSDISHELRSPLARLEVATELARDFAPEAEHYLARIEKESSRMDELIEQIIRIQSLQMRQYDLNTESLQQVNLYHLIDDIREDVCFEFQDKSVIWEWQCLTHTSSNKSHQQQAKANTEYTILGDKEQLHSAFENIIRNAFTHTAPNSKVQVVLQWITPTEENQRPAVSVQIIDSGEGVADMDLTRIFQPFVRLSASRSRLNPPSSTNVAQKYNGYGLGLAIAHSVIMAHQGQLTAYNRQDGQTGLIIDAILPSHE